MAGLQSYNRTLTARATNSPRPGMARASSLRDNNNFAQPRVMRDEGRSQPAMNPRGWDTDRVMRRGKRNHAHF